jgi:hypothetical protein
MSETRYGNSIAVPAMRLARRHAKTRIDAPSGRRNERPRPRNWRIFKLAWKTKRAAEAAELANFQARLEEPNRLLAEMQQGTSMLTEATLLSYGFHEHHGCWRLRR